MKELWSIHLLRSSFLLSLMQEDMGMKWKNSPKAAFIGMLGALSTILMMVSIPLPFAPGFLRFDVAELPALFAGFFIGPLGGCAVIVVKILLKLVIQGTDTAFVGELMNIIGSCAYVLPASLIYTRYHTKKGAGVSLIISTMLVSLVAVFLNAWIAFPMFTRLYGMPMEAIIGMGEAVNPLVHDSVSLMLFSVFPFNLLKHGVTSLVTWLIYKRVGNTLRAMLAERGYKKPLEEKSL